MFSDRPEAGPYNWFDCPYHHYVQGACWYCDNEGNLYTVEF